jgi:hypothetical protein
VTTAESCAEIERCITRLVREAPVMDAAVVAELIERLRGVGSSLALSIARIVELVDEGLIAPGVSLPHLAMSCATLADGVAGRLSVRELEAARYEIETLLPVPDGPRMKITVPDVPTAALSRGPRRRT